MVCVEKVTNTKGTTWFVNLCHLAPKCPLCVQIISHALATLVWESYHNHMDWGQENSEGAVKHSTPMSQNILNSAFWVHYSITTYDDGVFNQFWTHPPTCMTYMECKNDLRYCVFTIWPCGTGHHTTPWMLYIKIILSFVSNEFIQILCFCDECVQCHSEDCNFSFSS